MYYVIATDRAGSEMRPGGIVLHKQVFTCENREQAQRVARELAARAKRYSAVQTTQTMPDLNPWVYTWATMPAAAFLQGRC